MIADCLPVLFTDRAGTRVAAAHAGWRGLAGGVSRQHGAVANRSAASIRLTCWPISAPASAPPRSKSAQDVYDAFTMPDGQRKQRICAPRAGKWLADLFHARAARALRKPVCTQVYGGGLCTYADPARFYSYRRDKVTGRMAAFIWRE